MTDLSINNAFKLDARAKQIILIKDPEDTQNLHDLRGEKLFGYWVSNQYDHGRDL